MKEREILLENLVQVINNFKHDKDTVNKIKNYLRKEFKMLPGRVQGYINNPEDLQNVSNSELYIITNGIYLNHADNKINPEKFYTKREIKEVITNFEGDSSDTIEFPYTFKNVIKISDLNDDFIVKTDSQELYKLFPILQYNTETQREAKQRMDKDSGEIIETPKLVEKSVREMEELLKKHEMISTMITFNARMGSADEGEELSYNEDTQELVVNEGTLLDILDGFHRLNAIVRVTRLNPELNIPFKLNILNYDKKRAQAYFAQLNTTNPISKSHIKKMAETRYSDFIAKQLQFNSELRDRVSSSDIVAHTSSFLVTFGTISDAIDENFRIDNKSEAIKISKYLTEFINELFFSFPDEFMGDITEVKKESLLVTNSMFYGYFKMAARMQKEGIKLNKISEIINDIDFSRNNKQWVKYKITDKEGRITSRAKIQIYKFFNDIDLSKYKEGVPVE